MSLKNPINFNVYLNDELFEKLTQYCKENDINKSQLIRKLIREL